MYRLVTFLILLSVAALSSHAAAPPVNTPLLVITGASYAADWKTPPIPGHQVVNRGVNGDVTQQMLARFDKDVLSARPQRVLIWGHINNHHRAGDEPFESVKQRIQADYREMVARARQQGVAIVLATEVTLSKQTGFGNSVARMLGSIRGKEGYRERINRQVREVNVWLRTFATREKLPLLDFERVFDDGSGYRKAEYTSEDGSHISAAGYQALTRELAARRNLLQ